MEKEIKGAGRGGRLLIERCTAEVSSTPTASTVSGTALVGSGRAPPKPGCMAAAAAAAPGRILAGGVALPSCSRARKASGGSVPVAPSNTRWGPACTLGSDRCSPADSVLKARENKRQNNGVRSVTGRVDYV